MTRPRHPHPLLCDQRTIAGIGRSWVDEILWSACLSPFQRASDLDAESVEALRAACDEVLGGALGHYEQVIGGTVPDHMPMPLQVHRRAGEDCPPCGARIEAIHFKDHVMSYCPGGAGWRASAEGPAPLQAAEVASVVSGQEGHWDHDWSEKSRAQREVPVTVVSFSLWLSRSCCAFSDQGRR